MPSCAPGNPVGARRSYIGRCDALTRTGFVLESPRRQPPRKEDAVKSGFVGPRRSSSGSRRLLSPSRSSPGARRRARPRWARLRSPAGHEVVGPVGAVRQAGVRKRLQEGGRQGHGRQRAERPAEAALAGRAVHLGGRQGGHHHLARHRHVDRDPEEVHGRRWQDDRLRPPDRRRHGLRLHRVRRQPGGAHPGSRRHRRDEDEGHLQANGRSPSSGAARPTRTPSGSRAATTTF